MLNATEANEASMSLTYSREGTRDEKIAAHVAYRAEQYRILDEFREFLADEYASHLPKSVQDGLWNATRNNDGPFSDMEGFYIDLVDFADIVVAAVKS